jgi:hypothetical protein
MDICAIVGKYFSEYAFCPVGDGAVVLLAKFPYLPYRDPGEGYFWIDAYYPAANEVYRRTLALVSDLNAAGIAAERYMKYGYKDLAVKSGLADRTRRNTLAYSGQDGSRFVLGAALFNAQCTIHNSQLKDVILHIKQNDNGNVRNDDKKTKSETADCGLCTVDCKTADFKKSETVDCGLCTVDCKTADFKKSEIAHCALCIVHCNACVLACPTGAIAETGFDRGKCLRQYMADGAYPDAETARAAGRRLWGCDICQSCCPHNAGETVEMSAELKELLKIDGFVENVSARVKGLAPWIGKNYARPEKLGRLARQLLGVEN